MHEFPDQHIVKLYFTAPIFGIEKGDSPIPFLLRPFS